MKYNILNELNESYYLIHSHSESALLDNVIHRPLESQKLNTLLDVYKKLKNDPNSYSSSYFMEEGFPIQKITLRAFIIYYYDRGGHAILPIYFTNNEGEVGYIEDPEYHSEWRDFHSKRDCDHYKRILTLTFNHVLPDGKIIEYIFNGKNIYDPFKNIEMFFEMVKIKEVYIMQEELQNELSFNEDGESIIKKI